MCSECVGGSEEGTDVCVRETKISFCFFPTLAACSLHNILEFWEGVEEGCRLENIRRVADVPALIADPDLGTSP